MKQALCIKADTNLNDFINNKNETLDTFFVNRYICEKPENGFIQIIPYVTFYTTDVKNGKVTYVQYLRASTINEERLTAKTSVGFGGHIDQLEDITSTSVITSEDGTNHFIMNKEDLFKTVTKTANRELIEELGINVIEALNASINYNDCFFFSVNTDIDVNKVHVGFSIPVKLTQEQFDKFFEIVKINKDEIEDTSRMSINIKEIVEEMDITVTFNKISEELKNKYNLEDWSIGVINFITKKEISSIFKDVNYDDLVKIVEEKRSM